MRKKHAGSVPTPLHYTADALTRECAEIIERQRDLDRRIEVLTRGIATFKAMLIERDPGTK